MRTHLLRAAGVRNGRLEKHRRDFPRLAENVRVYVYAHGAECDVCENAAVRHVELANRRGNRAVDHAYHRYCTRGEKDGQHYPAHRAQSGYHRRSAGAPSRSGYAQCHAGASRGIVYQKHDLESAAPHQYGCGSAVRPAGLWHGQTRRQRTAFTAFCIVRQQFTNQCAAERHRAKRKFFQQLLSVAAWRTGSRAASICGHQH